MKNFIIILFSTLSICCNNINKVENENKILEFQKSLIEDEVTGSNIAMVFKDGHIVYKEVVNSGKLGDKDITNKTIFPIWSMSKPITTVAMMILLDRGLYKLDDNLAKYLPEYENIKCKGEDGVYPCKNKIRVIDLLTHRSGYQYYTFDGKNRFLSPPSPFGKYTSSYNYDNLNDFSMDVSKEPVEFEPGTKYTYGINQAILGRLIEVLSNQSFYNFLKENLFNDLNMNNTKFYLTKDDREKFQPLFINMFPNNPLNPFNQTDVLKGFTTILDELTYDINNHAHFGGEGLVSTFSDYSNFCEMLVNKGVYNGKQIISQNSFELMTKKYSNGYPDPNEPYAFPDYEGHYYGFTFSVLENSEVDGTGASKGIFGWSGYHNTHFWIDPDKKLFGLFMSRSREFSFQIHKDFRRVVYSTY